VLQTAFRRGGSVWETANGAAYDSAGNLYISALFIETGVPQTLSVQKYSGATLLWEQTAVVGGAWVTALNAGITEIIPALSIGTTGDVFVVGHYQGAASFGPFTFNGVAPSDAFVAELPGRPEPAVSLSEPSWTFAAHPPGVESGPGEIFVKNVGKAPLAITGAQILGGDNSFALTNNCPASLGINESCSLVFTITPTRTGDITATLRLIDNTPGSPQNIPIQGVGSGPVVHLSTATWDFSSHPVGQPSGSWTVYVTNVGNALLHFSSISITGQDKADFSIVSQTCGATLSPWTTCSVTFEFTPMAVGARTATLNFSDDAIPAQQSITLGGEGTTP
jgi:hypothetical protein